MTNAGQVQSWPTPEIFIKRGLPPRDVSDSGNYNIFLNDFVVYPPLVETVGPDDANYGGSLTAFTYFAPFPENAGTDDANYGAALTAFTYFSPMTENAGTDSGNYHIALTALTGTGPETRSVGPDTANYGIALTGFTAPALNSAVTNWAGRIVTNGGAAVSTQTKVGANNLYNALVANSLDTQIEAICLMVFDNLIASITPLIVGSGNDPWTNNGPFVSGDLTVNGLAGNGSSKYLDTGLSPSVFLGAATSMGAAVYCYTTNANGGIDVACGSGFSNRLEGVSKFSDNNTYGFTGGPNNTSAASPGPGYYSFQRTSSTSNIVYFFNSLNTHGQLGSTDTSSFTGPAPSGTILIFTGFSFTTNNRISAVVIMKNGLSAADDTKLAQIIQNFRLSQGGGFV